MTIQILRNLVAVLCISCWISTPVLATEIYVSKDAEGNTIFSDKPSGQANRHTIKELPSVPAFNVPAKTPSASDEQKEIEKRQAKYTSLSIISPANQFVLEPGAVGNLDISAVLSPGLRPGHSLALMANNKIVQRGLQSQFSLQNLSRGEHKFQILLKDEQDKTLMRSQVITVHVQRASIQRFIKPSPAK